MTEQATMQVSVAERNPQVGQTSNGKPKLGVKTGAGKWVQVTGQGVENIKAGQEIVISEPKQFGKQWFADLKEIKAAVAAAAANGNGASPRFEARPEKMSWDDFERTLRAAHAVIMECEPDGYGQTPEPEPKDGVAVSVPPVVIDRSTARAAMFNTIVIALTKDGGRVEPAPPVPF